MSIKYTTTIVTNGHILFSDKRVAIVTAGSRKKALWDDLRSIFVLKHSKFFVHKDPKEQKRLGRVIVMVQIQDDEKPPEFERFFVSVSSFPESKTKSVEEGLELFSKFGLSSNKTNHHMVGITENGFSFEIESHGDKIVIYEPGVLRVYDGKVTAALGKRVNEVFATRQTGDDMTKSAFLSFSSLNGGSVNHDVVNKKGDVLLNVKPTIEEEKEAYAKFFHPKYQSNDMAKRLWI